MTLSATQTAMRYVSWYEHDIKKGEFVDIAEVEASIRDQAKVDFVRDAQRRGTYRNSDAFIAELRAFAEEVVAEALPELVHAFDNRTAYKRHDLPQRAWKRLLDSDQTFAVISPRVSGMSRAETKEHLSALVRDIQALGLSYRSVQGKWAEGTSFGAEPALLVPGIDFTDAVRLGKAYGQDAVIYKDETGVIGMYDLNRGVVRTPASGGVPLRGSDALKVQERKSKDSGEPGLWSGLRSTTFEFAYDWDDPRSVHDWTSNNPVRYDAVTEAYAADEPESEQEETRDTEDPAEGGTGADHGVQRGAYQREAAHAPDGLLRGGLPRGAARPRRVARDTEVEHQPESLRRTFPTPPSGLGKIDLSEPEPFEPPPGDLESKPKAPGTRKRKDAPAVGLMDLSEPEAAEPGISSPPTPPPPDTAFARGTPGLFRDPTEPSADPEERRDRAGPALRLDPNSVWEWRRLAWDANAQRYYVNESFTVKLDKRPVTSPAGSMLDPGNSEHRRVLKALGIDGTAAAPFSPAETVRGTEILKASVWEQLTPGEREAIRVKARPGELLSERTERLKKVDAALGDIESKVRNKQSFVAAFLLATGGDKEDEAARTAAAKVWDRGPEVRMRALLEQLTETHDQLQRLVNGDYYLPRHAVDAPAKSKVKFTQLGVRPVDHAPNSPKRPDPKTWSVGVENILQVLRAARPDEIEYWRNWYTHANEDAMQLARRYRVPRSVAAGIIAAVSPNTPWEANVRAAEQLLRGAGEQIIAARAQGDPVQAENLAYRFWPELLPQTPGSVGSRVYLDNIEKAQRILDAWRTANVQPEEANERRLEWRTEDAGRYRAELAELQSRGWFIYGGAPDWARMKRVDAGALSSMGGFMRAFPAQAESQRKNAPKRQRARAVPPLGDKDTRARKVNAFFASINRPASTQDRVVVDGHAMNVWRGKRVRLDEVGGIAPETSVAVEGAYAEAARRSPEVLRQKGLDPTPLTPQQVQAVTWSVWRVAAKKKRDETDDGDEGAGDDVDTRAAARGLGRIALDIGDDRREDPDEPMFDCYVAGEHYNSGTLDEVVELVLSLGMTSTDVPPEGELVVRGGAPIEELTIRGLGGRALTEDEALMLLTTLDLPPTGTEGT